LSSPHHPRTALPIDAATPARSPTGCPISHAAAHFDPFSDDYIRDPAQTLRWARDQEPVFYSPALGYWIVTRYDDVKAVFRDNILFSPAIALEKITPAPPEAEQILKRYGYAMGRTMVNEDEPAHMARRRLLLDSFAPDAIAKHAPAVRHLTRTSMDRFIDKGRADLVADMFWEIPLTVALHFLGVREHDREQLRRFTLAHTINTWGRPTRDEQLKVADTVGRFWQAANRILDAMMAEPSGEGWMYLSIRRHLDHPDVVPLSYLRSMMMAILAAAHETTARAAANMFRLLLADRALWGELCRTPALIPNVVEESLRLAGSIVAWRRIATADAMVGGVAVPKGGKLLMVMASANSDEQRFADPRALDPYRENAAEHLSFGYGAHQCMGKNIARMEMRIFLEEFAKRLPHLQLEPDQNFRYLPNIAFRGPENLWVRWDPAQNPERRDPSVLSRCEDFPIGPPVRGGVARTMRISALHREADGILGVELESADGRPLPDWMAGAHIDVIAGGFERRYSLCGMAGDTTRYRIAVLLERAGRGGSHYIHTALKVGDRVQVRGPKTHFRLREDSASYLLIAGGIGITPILAMADRLKQLGRRYALHYCGRTRSAMAFLDRLHRDHGEAMHLHVSDEGQRLDVKAVTDAAGHSHVYACGPERLLAELSTLAAGWPDHRLHVEHFSGAAATLDPRRERAFAVELKDSDLTLTVPADRTLLDVLEAAGVDIACDCREGLCGSCEVAVVSGAVDHRDKVLSPAERERNDRMMACCSRARDGKLVLAL
jgi:cytochrome P450/ferredoxin-NADP reductase